MFWLFCGKSGSEGAQNEIFQLLLKTNACNVSDFVYIKLQWCKDLKLIQVIFIRKSFVLKFLRKKGPKMRLFKSFEKSVHGYFLIFYIKLEQLKDLKLTQLIFLIKNLVQGFQTERGPK